MFLTLFPLAMLPCPFPPSTRAVGKDPQHIWSQWFSINLKMFFYGYGFSLSFCIIIYLPAFLFVLSFPDPPAPSLQTMGFGIYDPVSDTYPESYPLRASLYLKRSLCSFTELSEHSLKDLVLRHCNSLFLMFLMCIPRHPGGLFIFPFSCRWASSPSPLPCFSMLSTLLENRRCVFDRNTALQVWFNNTLNLSYITCFWLILHPCFISINSLKSSSILSLIICEN